MALHTVLLLFISWSSMLHEGLGLPVLGQSEVVDEESAHRVRTKRCSCNNQLDYECHYFCHLDIIWVNTPSKTIVYGLGNALPRRRRSAGRCLCASSTDQTCNNFCAHSTKKSAAMLILSEQSKSETPLSDLQGALTERHSNAPAVAAVEGSVDRVCADVPAFLRNMVIARTLKRATAPTQRLSRVLRLSYR